MSSLTKAQKHAVISATLALADAVRELGSVPSGHLYARVMGQLQLEEYEAMIGCLIRNGIISKDDNHVLTWKGDK